MPSATDASLVQSLRTANQRLRSQLDRLIPSPARRGFATPQQIAGLLGELQRVGEWLRSGLPEVSLELEAELGEYRRNVEKLRDLLPFIHGRLVEERNRLEAERARVDSAARWAQGSRQTL